MDLVVNRLSEIETAAVRILDEATARNKELDAESAMELKKFDARTDEETVRKLDALRKDLDLQVKKKLSALQDDTEKTIQLILADYETNHERLANELLEKLIKE